MLGFFKSLFGLPSRSVKPAEALPRIRAGTMVIDVREPAEFDQGSIAGAVNVPLSSIDRLGEAALHSIPNLQSGEVLFVCRSGARSAAACHRLQAVLGERAFNIEGGMNAWLGAGLPLDPTDY